MAITFRAKNVAVYNIDKEMCMMKDETPRTAGLLATSCPSVFTGFFTTDTSFLALHEIYYACSVYIDFEDDNLKKAFVLPLPNWFGIFLCLHIFYPLSSIYIFKFKK